jgi:hypothetical protein
VAIAELAELAERGVQGADAADCGLVEDPSCRCRYHATGLPLDQRQAGFPFEALADALDIP